MKWLLPFIAMSCFAQSHEDVYVLNPIKSVITTQAAGTTGIVSVATQPTIAQTPFLTAVAFGDVEGYSAVNKFGYNPTADDGDDVWGGDGAYAFYPTNAQSVWVQSTDVDDVEGDTGAHTAAFYGLDANWSNASETVTLNGTTSVALTNTYVRMFRGIVLTTGSSSANEGDITVTNSVGTVAIHIEQGKGQTQHAIYTIPAGKSGVFIKGYVGMGNDDLIYY